jgi:Na+-transporting NADH:ubiquinone oxidoreductase subunit NqrD
MSFVPDALNLFNSYLFSISYNLPFSVSCLFSINLCIVTADCSNLAMRCDPIDRIVIGGVSHYLIEMYFNPVL